jgi:mono/diheme cytochrome c family protein
MIRRSYGYAAILSAALLMALSILIWVSPAVETAQAQSPAATPDAPALTAESHTVKRGLEVFKREAQCQFCHGWDGSGDDSEYGGSAPSLRATALTRDEIAETVKCGRIGAGMPYHDKNAYTTDGCYGMTEADLGDDAPPKPLKFLSERDIEAVADYVATVLKGLPDKPTLDQCIAFWGTDTRACDKYK